MYFLFDQFWARRDGPSTEMQSLIVDCIRQILTKLFSLAIRSKGKRDCLTIWLAPVTILTKVGDFFKYVLYIWAGFELDYQLFILLEKSVIDWYKLKIES